jgi:hypothetical protein
VCGVHPFEHGECGGWSHPDQRTHRGHAEIQTSPECHDIIDIDAVYDPFGFGVLGELQAAWRDRVDESLRSEGRAPMGEWAAGIAVGASEPVENAKADLGIGARHRDSCVSGIIGVLRGPEAACNHEMTTEKGRPGDEGMRFQDEA